LGAIDTLNEVARWNDLSDQRRRRLVERFGEGLLVNRRNASLAGYDWVRDDWTIVPRSYFRGRAMGGPVTAGTPYWVGERGRPELFVPSTNGSVVPQGRVGGTVIHQTNYITVKLDELQEMVEAGRFVRDLGQTRTLYTGEAF
jgi:hypothetical protein